MACFTASRPRTLRKVSCWPAKEASGQVLGGGRGAHRPGQLGAALGLHLAEGLVDGLLEVGGEGGLHHPAADAGTGGGETLDVVHVQGRQFAGDPLRQAVVGQKLAVGVGGGGEASGHAHAGLGQVSDHLPQGGVLAPHLLQVLHAEFVQPKDRPCRHCSSPGVGGGNTGDGGGRGR